MRSRRSGVMLGLRLVAPCAILGFTLAACGAAPPKLDDGRPSYTSIEIAELEISEVGPDRFASCPPPGELGQKWIPPIPAWTAIASSEDAILHSRGVQSALVETPPETQEPAVRDERGRAERAIVQTRAEFRKCYRRGLFTDPTQDGHVAMALRVDKDGKVAKVESYGACDIASEVVTCMQQVAAGLRFPPSGKADTVVVPVVFAGTSPRRTDPTGSEAYTAEAYVAIESARPALHACAISARREGKTVYATSTYLLDVDAAGKVTHAHVQNWTGDQGVLTCVADALSGVAFASPPAGTAKVMARVAINPRMGSR